MKVGDLVELKYDPGTVGVVISALNDNGFFDVIRMDGVVIFAHKVSLELISESR